jgi:opacity protein-like surface antigen
MHKILLLLSVLTLASFSGDTLIPVTTTPQSVKSPSGFYLGGGLGTFVLDDGVTAEELSANTALLIAGYQYNAYLSLEARYYRSIGDEMDYDAGERVSPDASYESTFTHMAAFLKLGYTYGDFSPYLLLGYGTLKLTNIAGADREESAMQYGVGVGYQVTDDFSLFVDWVRAYDDKGFDGRAIQDDLTMDLITAGVIYRF